MINRRNGWYVRAALCLGLAIAAAGYAQAAGEWEWTRAEGWTQGAGTPRPTPADQLKYAYDLEQRGEYLNSARQYFLLIQTFPTSQEAGVGLQRLARCLFEMENYYTSYKAIEQVIKDYPNTGHMGDLVEIELRIARKLMVSDTQDILSGRGDSRQGNIRRAIEILDSVIDHDPYGRVAAEAYLTKGEAHLHLNEIQASRAAFEKVIDEFPRSDVVERARYGMLVCDSLVGQATPQEVADQAELLREEQERRASEDDEIDQFVRRQEEVEARKMMDQATQYDKMKTPEGGRASKFLYEEIIRRYPHTPQASEAMDRLGSARTPREPGRLAKALKGVNINPFNTKDPEPPWIVPQLSAADTVMVDSAMGPVLGVPETGYGPPPVIAAPGVAPATLPAAGTAAADLGPLPGRLSADDFAPDPVVAQAGPGGMQSVPSPYGLPVPPVNPIPGTENDFIGMGGSDYSYPPAGTNSYQQPQAVYQQQPGSYYASPAPLPEYSPSYGSQPGYGGQPTLSSPMWNIPDSDLVGPSPRVYTNPPIPEYGTGSFMEPQPGSYYAAPPVTSYQAPMYQEPAPGYAVPGGLRPNGAQQQGSGGWTFGDEFR